MVFPRCFLALLLSLAAMPSGLACLNEYKPNKPNVPAIRRSHSLLDQLTQHATEEPWISRRDRLRKQLEESGDFRVKNDLASALLHTGEAVEAVKLLEEVEAEKPGLYFTAANLGTAYELSGDDRRAIEWIRKGIERNPEAHGGTEWLHVRILETKLALAQDPQWLESHSVVYDQETAKTAVGNRGEKLTVEQVKKALIYQLHERLQFVRPPESVVGALLLELGELVAQEPEGLGGAAGILELASKYLKSPDAPQSLVTQAGVKWGKAVEAQSSPMKVLHSPLFTYGGMALLGAMVVALIVVLWRSRARAPEL
jgi:hypothetical protein